MKTIHILCSVALFLCLCAATAAASTSVGLNVSRGSGDSTAFSLNLMQKYDSWLDSSLFSLTPLAEIGGHVWVPDDDGSSVWGLYLAPGLRFSLFTEANLRPYLEGSVGGALNTKKKIDNRRLGSNVLFRSRGSVGISFGDGFRHKIQGDYINYSTWGLTDNDSGYNTYGISYGYSF